MAVSLLDRYLHSTYPPLLLAMAQLLAALRQVLRMPARQCWTGRVQLRGTYLQPTMASVSLAGSHCQFVRFVRWMAQNGRAFASSRHRSISGRAEGSHTHPHRRLPLSSRRRQSRHTVVHKPVGLRCSCDDLRESVQSWTAWTKEELPHVRRESWHKLPRHIEGRHVKAVVLSHQHRTTSPSL